MPSKTCFKCLVELPLTEFYGHPQMGDGHLNKCKACTRHDTKAHREKRIDHYRAYDRARGARQPASYIREYRARFPNRYRAHNLVYSAIKHGHLVPEPCFVCGDEAEAHHPDYSAPLDVVWLCPPHHKQAHALVRGL